ncbi:MAG: prepilin peptidase [Chloroflexi bacterium]|nr:prepilin peptidase [Chloroflexota bacterium]
MSAVVTTVFVLVGLAVGSFLNLCVDRLPAGISVVRGRSRCDACGHVLGVLDLVPLLGYLWLRGRCRFCGSRIPLRALLVEAVTGALFGFLVWRYSLTPQLAFALVYAAVLVLVFVIDLEKQLVLDQVVLPAMALGLAGSFFWPQVGPVRALAGGALGAALLGLPYLLYRLVARREGMGAGDILVGGMVGLMVGFPLVLVAMVVAMVAGGLAGSLFLAFGHKTRQDPLPFATFLTASAGLVLLWGRPLLDWYRGWA